MSLSRGIYQIQAAERKERKETKNMKRMGEDGIGDDDLQVVSGERDLENLAPKERAKLEKKRGLIRAGMGAAADDVEDTGFEVAKATGAAMAMLGKRYKPKFAVDGLDEILPKSGNRQMTNTISINTVTLAIQPRFRSQKLSLGGVMCRQIKPSAGSPRSPIRAAIGISSRTNCSGVAKRCLGSLAIIFWQTADRSGGICRFFRAGSGASLPW